MLGTWGLHGWVAGAAPDRFAVCTCDWRVKGGECSQGTPSLCHPGLCSPPAPELGWGTAGAAPLHHPELKPLPWLLLANTQQGQHLVHFIHFISQWSDVTFLLLSLEKYSLRTNFPHFPQAAKYTKQAETFFLNASGGCGSSSLVLFQRLWINGYGITITEQRIIEGFLLLCDNLHCILSSCSTTAQFCSWMLAVCVLGIKFFCLGHFCTNHSQICDCVRAVNCLLLWKALRLGGWCIIWEDIGSLAQMLICLSRTYTLVYNLNSKSVLNLNFVEQKKNHLMLWQSHSIVSGLLLAFTKS